MTENTERLQPVDVRNFDMSFGRMVIFMIKWAIAAIPAIIILTVVGLLVWSILTWLVLSLQSDKPQARSALSDDYSSYSSSSSYSGAPRFDVPAQASIADELKRGHDLLAAGKAWDAYAIAHSLSVRSSLSRDQKREVQALKEEAWAASRK